MTLCPVSTCQSQTPDGLPCTRCMAAYGSALSDLAEWLADALDGAVAKQLRFGPGPSVRSGGDEQRLPVNLTAAAVRSDLHALLVSWARLLVEELRLQPPADDTRAICRWLLAHQGELRAHPAAGDAIEEICAQRATVAYAVDRPAELAFLGVCDAPTDSGRCPASLYAPPGRPTTACRVCGARHDVPARQRALSDAVRDQLATISEIVRVACVMFGATVDPSRLHNRVRQWAHRRELEPRGDDVVVDGRPRHRYRVGDALGLILDDRAGLTSV